MGSLSRNILLIINALAAIIALVVAGVACKFCFVVLNMFFLLQIVPDSFLSFLCQFGE